MTDRFCALTVILENDMRDDDAESLITAIQQLRGVLKIEPQISGIEIHIGKERARIELGKKLWNVLYPKKDGG